MGKDPDCFDVTHSRVSEHASIAEGIAVGRVGGVRRKTAGYTVCCPPLADLYETPLTPKHTSSSFGAPLEKPVCSAATITTAIASFREILLYNTILYCVIPSNFACLDLTRLARGLAGRMREGPAKSPLGMAANYAESDVGEEEEEEEDDGNDNEVDEEEEEEEEERSGRGIYEERLLVVEQNVGEEPRERVQREERREETRRVVLPQRWAPRSLRSMLSLKARGRFSEATGAGGIRVELDYTAKGYIYRARMYAEARTSPQRGRPCGFSLDATWRVDSRFRTRHIRSAVGADAA
ncbi:hypothetical protein ALC56_14225 [Trachymyrmex septentrionalis]|uniref:Uncharacterized protein n=1 Tax=Trachymyrmex septentrionalis TaxID=34720 RepID=A0A195ETY8_9HYME|nr:hypothetical protein ALC56_14225 [Trachymyrmex septentrionalis]